MPRALAAFSASFRAVTDLGRFVLGHGGQQVNGQSVGIWIVASNELNAAFHQASRKENVSAPADQV